MRTHNSGYPRIGSRQELKKTVEEVENPQSKSRHKINISKNKMKGISIFLLTGIISCRVFMVSAQTPVIITENFDGNTVSFKFSPADSWEKDTNYYVSAPAACLGMVPNLKGDVTILETPAYNFSTYDHVLLRFKHICKVSPMDIVRVEYRISGQGWKEIPAETYLGKAINYNTKGFSAASYSEWQANDSLALPKSTWFKEESFDVSFETQRDKAVQFRFVIQHGTVAGTQISYGWLLDDIEIITSVHEVKPPIVEFMEPLVKDTVYTTGTHTIKARVKTQSGYSIQAPWLVYTSTINGISVTDSVAMTAIASDSIWEGIIPQFVLGTNVTYSIRGKDIQGNYAFASLKYIITKNQHNYGDVSVALTSIASPIAGLMLGGISTPVIVTIRNRGDSVLTSATIKWSVNGVSQTYPWTGYLEWDMETSINLGNYMHSSNMHDTILVWVSSPNHATDPVLSDDTLKVISYGCFTTMSGNYIIGNGGVFSDMNNFLTILKDCSPAGNITLLLQTGIYAENWDLSNIGNLMGNYTLTITSAATNADSVILRPASGVGIKLANNNNLVIKGITVDATAGTYAVQFTNACTNIVIRDCKLLANPTIITTGYAPIYKASSTGIVDSIFIINNLLDGGYYGTYFYGGSSSSYNKHIVFDSNTVSNQYYYGTYFYYTDLTSCSYNKVLSRMTNISATWYGLYLYYANGTITGNHIKQCTTTITSPYGIYLRYYNYYNTSDTGLVANNEIILNTTSTYSGIYAYSYTKAKILHNSIYISGTGAAYGICITSSSYTSLVVMNNNIIMESSSAYPIYVSATTYLSRYNMDYNNMYAPTHVGYAGAAKTTMTAWRQTVTTDSNSTNVHPGFINNTVNLEMSNYANIHCNILPEVTHDINNRLRTGAYTGMGCYHPYKTNVGLKTITGWRQGIVSGQSDSIKIQIENRGKDTITSFTLNWSINGNVQTGINWTGSLPLGENLNFTLGSITYTAGIYTIKAWINAVNGSQDESAKDDTLNVSAYVCSSPLNGTYSIGATGTIPNWESALERANICGVSGDVIFEFQPGTYMMSINLNNKSSLFGDHTLTLISTTHNAADVIFQTTTTGITLNNSNNIIIKDITIDATAGTYAIQFTGACTNVIIRDCKLLANSTATTVGYAPIYKAASTGIGDSIFIINNLLDGGYYGVYLYGASTSSYNKHIVFDSNTVSNQYYYGTYFYYTDLTSCSYNKILSRTANTTTTWDGIYLNYANGLVTGNHIKQCTKTITTPYGIYLTYYNYYNTTDTGLVANNEIILNTTSTYSGIYANSYTKAKILHNSIYLSGTGAARGIEIISSAYTSLIIKNNNIIMSSSSAYPIYVSATTNLSRYNMDYNNMYAPTYIGYAGGNKTTISAWQQTVTTDKNSISVRKNFVDSTVKLELVNYNGLECEPLSEAPADIQNAVRGNITAIGCYKGFTAYLNNASLRDIQAASGLILGTSNQVKVILINMGTAPLTNATFNWSFNGVIQSPTGVSWTGNLAPMAKDTVELGMLTYTPAGYYTIKAWIHDLGSGSQQDMFSGDDTTEYSAYICPSAMNDLYTIGITGTFKTFKEALDRMSLCGVSGDVTLAFQPDTYNEKIDLKDIPLLMGAHTLTLTSTTHKATDVIFPTTTVGITLNNNNNIVIKDITIDATAGTYAIQFTGACTNVTIRDCKLLANPTATATGYAPIYKAASTGIVDSIFIINNLLDGGYYGVYLYGASTSSYNKHIIFDSNTVSNQYYYGIYFYYTDFTSCSCNKILSRTANTTTTWDGIYLYYANGPVTGNHIKQCTTTITTPYGIYLTYYNYSNTTDTGLVANNEIILNTTSTYSGIYAYSYTKAKILHNSIYISGTGAARGIYIYNSTYTSLVVKNNNIIMESSSAYPIYVSTYASQFDMDYNNMYAPTYIGYAGAAKTTIAAWQQTVTTDKNSVSVHPRFIDSTINLKLVNCDSMECILLSEVPTDRGAAVRGETTVMGCYKEFATYPNNAKLTDIQAASGAVLGISNTVKAVLINKGAIPLTNATLNWSFNGVIQSPTGISWTGNLALLAKDTVELGMLTYTLTGDYTITAWIHDLGSQQDMFSGDDTAEYSAYICSSAMNGLYTIGTTGTFKTFKEALDVISLCGVVGDVTLAFQPDTYNEKIDLKDIPLLMGAHTLTLTSTTHKATDVIFPTTTVGITLNNNNNIVIKDITIDATAGTYAVQFTGACTNVTIRDCRLLANPTITSTSGYAPIYKTSSTGIVDSIFIINNLLDGGSHGFYFYGGTSTAYGTHVVFDSNTVSNQYAYGVYSYYVDCISCSYNTVLSRMSNTYTTWYGMCVYYTNGPVTGNRIKQRSTAISYPYGIYLQYYNYYNTTDTGMVANNEIILNTTSAYYGICAYSYTKAKILHNSIYISGTGAAYGIYIYSSSYTSLIIKNNNIIMKSSSAYPIYVSATTYLSQYNMDYNNMYAPTNVGYAGSAKTTITNWQTTVTTDKNSVRLRPDFIDSSINNLQLNEYMGFECTPLSEVPVDIDGQTRAGSTVVGCYHSIGCLVNAMLKSAFQWESNLSAGISDTVKVEITNTARDTITSATIYWSFNNSVPPQSYTWSGSLSTKQSVILTLDTVTFTTGSNTLDIWIENLGALEDEISRDDSIHVAFQTCNAGMSGVYTIGRTAMFSTIDLAFAQINSCGVTGDITLALQPGSYKGTVDLSNIPFSSYTFTITSTTQNAADVIFSTNTGITLSNNNNIIIKAITVDAAEAPYGIVFNNPCSNIVIRDCRILANPAATTDNSTVIYKSTSGGDNIHICNNKIDGGCNGIYLKGGTNVMIDSNHISGAYNYSLYADGTHFTGKGISFNRIEKSRTGTWCGIYLTSTVGNITGNRIYTAPSMTLSTGSGGIYVSNHNANETVAGLIANNEVHLVVSSYYFCSSASYYDRVYGIKTSSSYSSIIHNSIYMSKPPSSSGGSALGIEIISFPSNKLLIIKNNNVYVNTGSSPIYQGCDPNRIRGGVVSAPTSIALPSQHNIDYNNFAGSNAANVGTNCISVIPDFVDTAVGLMLENFQPFLCPSTPEVLIDIAGMPRISPTLMGAYSGTSSAFDLMLQEITRMEDEEVIVGQKIKVGVKFINAGTDEDIDSLTFRWSLNGTVQPNICTWIPTSPLTFGQIEEILLDSFIVSGSGTIEVVVWAETVNGVKDSVSSNDSLLKTAAIVPLMEFAEPFVADTINALSFDLYVIIREQTGALIATPVPKMTVQTTLGNGNILHDTVNMEYDGASGLWEAQIPQQYYGSTVSCSLTVSDTTANNAVPLTKTVYLEFAPGSETYTGYDLGILSLNGLTGTDILCSPDYVPLSVTIVNAGDHDYDFTNNPVNLHIRVTTPIPFSLDTVITMDTLISEQNRTITLTDTFSLINSGQYDFKVWIESQIDNVPYDDTLLDYYVSGRFSLPVDKDFSGEIPVEFIVKENNTLATWAVVPQGMKADTMVKPVFGTDMLSFTGSRGAMTTLSTRQLDLSNTVQPSLSFWYFHDTIPSKDYTDVRITVDGGTTYTTLFSLRKYNPVYGWKQYDVNLPLSAINQCVILVFEAMEKSLQANVTQYIDRIRITARQDIAISEIIVPQPKACDSRNKELKVVMDNLTDLTLNYASTPTTLYLEVKETGQTFTYPLTSGSLAGFSSDTITVENDFDFGKGTYTFKAYFSSLLDVDRQNDTLETSVSFNPGLNVQLIPLSGNNLCLRGGTPIWQDVTLINTGETDLFDITLILQIDTGETGDPAYIILTETCTDTIHSGDSHPYSFKQAYNVPWNISYYPRIYAYLTCDSALVNTTTATSECVNMEDLYMVSIDNPSVGEDKIGESIQVRATLRNRSDINTFPNLNMTVVVEDSRGIEIARFSEPTGTIGILAMVSHTFSNTYIVPDDSVYYLTVYIDHNDDYLSDDTLTIKRTTKEGEKDLSIISIDNPSSGKDVVGGSVQVSASVRNESEYENYSGLRITVLVEDPQGQSIETFTEIIDTIERLSTVSYTFTNTYTVPDDSVYYLYVYIDSYDNYSHNDTLKIKRETRKAGDSTGIYSTESIKGFMLNQNIPNPANNSTRIDYNVPDAGKIVFHVHSITGQLLYSKTIEAEGGTNSIELNTSTFAAGVYFYSMEYKGQRLVRQLIINSTN